LPWTSCAGAGTRRFANLCWHNSRKKGRRGRPSLTPQRKNRRND